MSEYLQGFPVEPFQEVIGEALQGYFGGSEYKIDIDQAAELAPTPHEPYAAHSEAGAVMYGDEVAAELQVVVFGPGDGTGRAGLYSLADVYTERHPATTNVLPVWRPEVHTEVHLTLAAASRTHLTEPTLYAGNLCMLGVREKEVVQIGELGTTEDDFARILPSSHSGVAKTKWEAGPEATITVGHKGSLYFEAVDLDKRFGDPAAIYNPWGDSFEEDEVVQACAFVRLPQGSVKHGPGLMDLLEPLYPHLGHIDDDM